VVVVVEVVDGTELQLEAVPVEECVTVVVVVVVVVLLLLAASMVMVVVMVVWRPADHRNNTQFN